MLHNREVNSMVLLKHCLSDWAIWITVMHSGDTKHKQLIHLLLVMVDIGQNQAWKKEVLPFNYFECFPKKDIHVCLHAIIYALISWLHLVYNPQLHKVATHRNLLWIFHQLPLGVLFLKCSTFRDKWLVIGQPMSRIPITLCVYCASTDPPL